MNEKTKMLEEILKEKNDFKKFLDENIETTDTTISLDLSRINKKYFKINELNSENLKKLIS